MEPDVETADPRGRRRARGRRARPSRRSACPHTDYGLATYYIVAPAEASANLARYDGVRYGPRLGDGDVLGNYLATRGQGFGAEVKRRIMLGTYALSAGYYDAYYLKAQKVRTLIKRDFDVLWEQGFDALVAPTSPSVAFQFGAKMADPVAMYLSDACTLPVNMAGLPGISIPCGLSEGLPVGLQLIGAAWSEAELFELARGYEALTSGAEWRGLEPAQLAAASDPAAPTPAERAGTARGSSPVTTDATRAPLADRALAERVRAVPPSGIRRFFDILATMDDVISLGVGEPDFDTPERIVAAGVRSLHAGRTHYTSNYGTIELRRALADHLERRYGVAYDPASELLVTVGASEAVDLALRATCDPGDEVILHEPSYVAYVPAVVFAGGVVRHVATRLDDDFALDPAARRGGDHAAHEGAVPRLPVQPDRRRPARRRPGGDRGHRPPPRPARVQRRDLRPARLRLVPAPGVQLAAGDARADDPHGRLLEGVRDDRLARRLAGGARGDPRGDRQGPPVRDHVGPDDRPGRGARGARSTARRTSSGWSPSTTAAGGSSSTGSTRSACGRSSRAARSTRSRRSRRRPGSSSEAFAQGLLEEERVAVIPGSAFGPSGEGHVRACYATSYEQLEEALVRIGRFVERHPAGAAR